MWKRREKGKSIGRIANASPSSGELYYLRILLTKVRGPRSYAEIRTVHGIVHPTFRAACDALSLLDDDQEFVNAIKVASVWASGYCLRKLFVSMLVSNSLQRPEVVWNECSKLLSEDMLYISHAVQQNSGLAIADGMKADAALREIEKLLTTNGKSLQDYPGLPTPNNSDTLQSTNNLIIQELSYDRPNLQASATSLINSLTTEQKAIFDTIMSSLNLSSPRFFFVHGFGGTGKTFLWNALASAIRGNGEIVLTVATSGIAATLLPAGRTAHSRFAIPIQINEYSMCSIRQKSPLAELLISTKLIIWDEALMIQRFCLEAFDRTLRDIMHSSEIFGGKCIVMGGDFRQILPVMPKGSRASIVNASISSSFLWDYCKIFHLTKNMRLTSASCSNDLDKLQWFTQWLLDVGDGNLGESEDGISDIEIPHHLLVPDSDNPMESIVAVTYVDLQQNLGNNEYFNDRAILAPTIEMVSQINDYMCSLLPGETHEFLSCDSVCKSSEDIETIDNLYTTEFLNTINSSGLPPHKLLLKVGAPIMLLRNIDQTSGLCNGTRLRISRISRNVIEGITLNGSHPNQTVLIHRMDMNPSESRLPFHMRRRQFPITLCFAMTINKSQGQSLRHVDVFLSKPVFTHGQLYVALSRVRSIEGLKIYVPRKDGQTICKTKNVVYKEVFMNLDT